MRVMIEIAEDYIKLLSKWASVSRTLNTARRACEDLNDETYTHCANELELLIPALESMHYASRQKMWELQDSKTVFCFIMLKDKVIAIGTAQSFDDFVDKAARAGYNINTFSIGTCSRDKFEYLCQEGKLPIFP